MPTMSERLSTNWVVAVSSFVLILVAGLFMWNEQLGIDLTSVSKSDDRKVVIEEQFNQLASREKDDFDKLSELISETSKRIGTVEETMNANTKVDRDKLNVLNDKITSLEKQLNKGDEEQTLDVSSKDEEAPSGDVAAPSKETPITIEDFTSCSNFKGVPVSVEFPAPKVARKYEMIRLGVSDFCNPLTTDISVFFTWQESGDCLDQAKSHASVRYWKKTTPAKKTEVDAQMAGCFTDDHSRTWRFFTARMSRLEPDVEYVYTLENEKQGVTRIFFSPPLPGSEHETQFVIFGDSQIPAARSVFDSLATFTSFHDLVIHVGDSTYATNNGECYGKGSSREANDECGWNCTGTRCAGVNRMSAAMMDRIRPWVQNFDESIRGRMPWMTTMGNHDNDLQWFLSQRPCVSSALPGVHPGDINYESKRAIEVFAHSNTPMKDLMALAFEYMKMPHFYSFDFGKAHVISIGTEDNPNNAYEAFNGQPLTPELIARFDRHYGRNSRQYSWLIKDLTDANARRTKVPWIILYTHRPMFHTSTHHPNCGGGGDWYVCLFRDAYEPLFRQFGVNIVATGHSHHYSRSHPMFQGKIDREQGVVHSTIGTGGFGLTNAFGRQPEWIAMRTGSHHGYVRLAIVNSTHAKWTFLSPGEEGQHRIVDDAWILRHD